MKTALALLFIFVFNVHAQDPKAYLSSFDSKIYSLKNRGVKDFTVDISSPKLTRQLNEQGVFGKVEKLTFRLYWTAMPERIAVAVLGLPDGFNEVKESLKRNVLLVLEDLLPVPMEQKFSTYAISQGPTTKELIAKDQTGVAPIQSFVLKFNDKDILTNVIGKKAVGIFNVENTYESNIAPEGKLVLTKQITSSVENGLITVITKELDYTKSNGIVVLDEVSSSLINKIEAKDAKAIEVKDLIEFSNYKINVGEALKYFLSEDDSK
jgi:hypothetical protein